MPDVAELLNRKLAIAIVKDGRRQYVIAHLAGMHPNQLSAIKNGGLPASDSAKRRIADALGLTVAELFDDESSAS